MGALVVLDYPLDYSQGLRGAILSGAPIEPVGVGKLYQIILARILTHVLPRVPIHLGLDEDALSRDPNVAKVNQGDPLLYHDVTVRWGTESLDAVARVKARIAEINVPILLLHGEADRLNLAQGSRFIFDRVTHADKTLRIYPGGLHEPHNDLDHKQVEADVVQWLDQHL